MKESLSHAEVLSRLAPFEAGSCALLAIYDPATSILRVACAGDSRGVLGRSILPTGSSAVKENEWTAIVLTEDQTCKNPDELARLQASHPGENDKLTFNTNNGRMLGLALTRAFGDSRWKISQEDVDHGTQKYNAAPVRSQYKSLYKSPPYLTAEPVVQSTEVRAGDFLILASDGVWDNISSENAVKCVGAWVDEVRLRKASGQPALGKLSSSSIESTREKADPENDFPMIHTWGWQYGPEDLVVEENNAATHLAKNVLGGKRREMFCSVMSTQPPHSRDSRDDITIQVIFFGDALSGK